MVKTFYTSCQKFLFGMFVCSMLLLTSSFISLERDNIPAKVGNDSILKESLSLNFSASTADFNKAEITVTGTVSDDTGEALPGTSILVKGTTTGSVSDVDGKYSIAVPDENSVLVFSFIGYSTQERVVGNLSKIDVTLSVDASDLEEVVVTGYGTTKKSDLTGSVISAPLKNFEEAPNTNILQALNGTTPGVNIGQVSTAGSDPSIQVRGQTSLNGNQSPLIVLDGVFYRGKISDLNPRDIQSIDILKDASSKAIYGAQAANGVIIITSKTGKKSQKPVISYSGFIASQNPANELTPLGRDDYLKSARDVDWQRGYVAPDYLTENPDWTLDNNTGFFPPLMDGLRNGTDYSWYDEVTSPGYINDQNVSIRGSSDNTSYFISGGYTDQTGWMLNDKFSRVTGRINLDTDITKWLKIGINTFGSFTDYSGDSPDFNVIPTMSPLVTSQKENGEYNINPLGDFRLNPFLQAQSDNRDLRNNISAILYADVKIPFIEGLSYRVNFSNNYRWSNFSTSNPYDGGLAGRAQKNNSWTHDLLLDNIVTYTKELNSNHRLTLTGLYGFNKIVFDETRAVGTDFTNLTLSYNSLQQALIQRIGSSAWEESYLYQMGRFAYDFKRRYLFTATIRRDGFSGFSENNKFGVFPSIGLGWVISEESFLANAKNIDFLKFRASYGVTGNLTSRYSSLATVSSGPNSQYVFGDGASAENGQRIVSLSNPDLSWERTGGVNFGLDADLFDGRISANLDYYESTTNDLLWNFVLPNVTGFSNIVSNVGEINNKGLELVLNTKLIQAQDFSWDFGFNFSRNTNRIDKLIGLDRDGDGKEDDLIANNLFIGQSIGTIYGFVIDGIWQVGDEIPKGFEPGLYKLKDLDGDGNITPQGDRQILGRTEPAYRFGIQNTLKYKDFTLRFFINSVQGGSNSYLEQNNPWAGVNYGTVGTAQSSNWYSEVDYWSPSNPGATYRRPGPDAGIAGQRYFSRSFVRLQDISFSYSFNSTMLEKVGMQSFKVFVSGKNLLTFTDWEGWDPETGQGLGAEAGQSLPVMKGFSIGLDVSF
jgi:TonB-linked SusC/RagA family outer membrane protein